MLQPGLSKEHTFSVTDALTAKTVGSGTLEVLATPILIARMEEAAWTCVAPYLAEGESTVGTLMNLKHLSPTPVGMEVTCRAELIQVDGRRLVFHVTAQDSHSQGPVGEGTHERAIIQNERFLTKAQKKLAGSR
ncbi:MAG: thioesterase family protein [Clostridiales bacterium]|nr:thioesterase family protein [Clostridiales bacterium]MDY4171872.1 thioesterase family protein [Evtepia sp.]